MSLPQWQLVTSQPLKPHTFERPPFAKLLLPGRHYRYIQNDLHLDIKMRYEIETNGDVKDLVKKYNNIKFSLNKPSIVVRQHAQLGFYGLFVYKDRAYLDACINSQGGSTFTPEQFSYNRLHYDVKFNRLLAWLFIQQQLRDNRCLWTDLSIPLNQSSPESAYAILENAWEFWQQWWRPRFPKP